MKIRTLSTNSGSIVLSLVSVLVLTAVTFGQGLVGTLSGEITDERGNVLPGAVVSLIDSRGRVAKVVSAPNGSYTFAHLAPGRYQLEVTSPGFAVFKYLGISVESGKDALLDIQLRIQPISESLEIESDSESKRVPRNSRDVELNQEEIDEQLPDDPDALADALRAMAPSGPGEPQIFVDGFETSRPPPKQTIREIRISSNIFSAEDDRPSGAKIQIFTKSGMDKFHGGLFFNLSDNRFNARNPFADDRPPYSYRQYGLNVSGTIIPKKASFFSSIQRLDQNESGIVTARVLSSALEPVSLNSPFAVPRRELSASSRADWQLNEGSSLSTRYNFNGLNVENVGVGELTLSERGYDLRVSSHLLQLSLTSALNSQTANEFRIQYLSTSIQNRDANPGVSINVQDSFLGGGSGLGRGSNKDIRFELQNYVTANFSKHLLRTGIKLRSLRINEFAPSNFNGSFTFTGGAAPLLNENNQIVFDPSGQPVITQITSIERYRRTLLLKGLGFTPEAIRLRGGGATQFSISQGDPRADVDQLEFGLFLQQEIRLKPSLNLYVGLRYEGQSNIRDFSNLSPRFAFAWVPKIGNKQNTTIRSGLGLYYNRLEPSYIIQSRRFDGIRLQRFVTSDPRLTDLFPNLPTTEILSSLVRQQSVTRLADNVQAGRTLVALFNVEHKVSPSSVVTFGFSNYRTRHNLRQRNINAPLPGTFVYGQSGSGIRPYGSVGDVLLLESSNDYFQNQFYLNYRNQINSYLSVYINYLLSDTRDGGSIGGFPANSYDLRSEWGRASSFSVRHRLYMNSRIQIPKIDLVISPQVIIFSQRPFNITTGIDTNGDQQFMERPAITAAADGVGIYNTRFGIFDVNPSDGQQIIPRNIGKGPSFLSLNTIISRTFPLGRVSKTSQAKQSEKPYRLVLSIQIQNLLNKVNLATPIGNLSSPLFGESISTSGAYGFENGSSAYNRRIEAQVRFTF